MYMYVQFKKKKIKILGHRINYKNVVLKLKIYKCAICEVTKEVLKYTFLGYLKTFYILNAYMKFAIFLNIKYNI